MNNQETSRIIHPIEPIWNNLSRVLILGTMPSPKSRENGFYYAHPRNRFWQVMEIIYNCKLGDDKASKISFLLANNIAMWDVIKECDICGASDSSIKNIVPNDIASIVQVSEIQSVFTTGTTAFKLYNKYCKDNVGIEAVCLPSTSPANAAKSLNELVTAYSVLNSI